MNNMWKAVGEVHTKRPNIWLSLPSTVKLIENMGKSNVQKIKQLERTGKIEKSNYGIIPPLENAGNTGLYYGVRGHYGGTYAHWRVAVRYAEYLDSGMARYIEDLWGRDVLTKMWKACGEDLSRQPAMWFVLPSTKKLIESIDNFKREKISQFNVPENIGLFYTQRGRTGGTYAHWRVAVRYAE